MNAIPNAEGEVVNAVDYSALLKFHERYLAESANNHGDWFPFGIEAWRSRVVVTDDALRNFRRNWISAGVYNRPDRPKEVDFDHDLSSREWDYGPDWPKRSVVDYAHLLRRLILIWFALPAKLRSSFRKNCGDGGSFGGAPLWVPGIGHVTEASLRYSYYALQVLDIVGPEATVLEIGAGVGGLCSKIHELGFRGRYLITDLQINATLISANLGTALGERFGRYWRREDRSELDRPVVFVAPWLLGELTEKVDICINTASFQHMTMANLKYYGRHLNRLESEYIFHQNRTSVRDPTDVPVDDYPFRGDFNVVWRRPSMLGGTIVEELLKRN